MTRLLPPLVALLLVGALWQHPVERSERPAWLDRVCAEVATC